MLLAAVASVILALVLAPPDEAHADTTVPPDWPLIPRGVDPGDQFRLMFATHGRDYTTDLDGNRSFERLDDTVQNAARHGLSTLKPYADEFQALASCGNTDARHHTSTTYTASDKGVPIYWLRGDKVADDYEDFYDGSWDSLDARNQIGWSWDVSGYAAPMTWTGTNTDGTSSRHHVCTSPVTYGYADDYRPGKHFNNGVLESWYPRSLYALSSVFTVSSAPGTIKTPAVVSTTHNTTIITWNAPTSHGATPIFDYNVQVKRAGGSWVGSTPYHWGTHTTHTLTGLSPDTVYQVRVFAKNHGADLGGSEIGYGPASPAATFRTQTVTPSAPTGLKVSPDDTSAFVRWSVPEWLGAPSLRDYSVNVRQVGGVWYYPGFHGSITTHTIGNLSPDTGYEVRVRANNSAGDGPWTPVVTFRTLPPVMTVPNDWPLTPSGIEAGDRFRLIFVTSDTRLLSPPTPASFHLFVQDAASSGHEAIEQFSSGFHALVSTRHTTSLSNTATQHSPDNPGMPIYWVGGDKVADDYRDFYDGCWDSNDPRDENGDAVGGEVWTGSKSDGTRSGIFIGETFARTGNPASHCWEISDRWSHNGVHKRVYGISPVFSAG